MENGAYSPERKLEAMSWVEYEDKVLSLMRQRKKLRGQTMNIPLSVSAKIPQPYSPGSDYSEFYRYEFQERRYGFFVRITSANSPRVDEDRIVIGREMPSIDAQRLIGVRDDDARELVLKFYRSVVINGKRTQPVMESLVNPTEVLYRMKSAVLEQEFVGLSKKEYSDLRRSGEMRSIEVVPDEIFGLIDKERGQPLEQWHPSHDIDIPGKAYEITKRAIQG